MSRERHAVSADMERVVARAIEDEEFRRNPLGTRPLIASHHIRNTWGQKALLLERLVQSLTRAVDIWSLLARRGLTLLVAGVVRAVGPAEHPVMEREGRHGGEVRRLTQRTTLGSDAYLRAAYTAHGAELYRFALRSLGMRG